MAPHKSTRYTVTNNSNACKISILPHTPVTIHINRSYLNVQLSNFNGELVCNPYGYSSGVYTTHLPIKLKKKIGTQREKSVLILILCFRIMDSTDSLFHRKKSTGKNGLHILCIFNFYVLRTILY